MSSYRLIKYNDNIIKLTNKGWETGHAETDRQLNHMFRVDELGGRPGHYYPQPMDRALHDMRLADLEYEIVEEHIEEPPEGLVF